jgi:hypothetical protein
MESGAVGHNFEMGLPNASGGITARQRVQFYLTYIPGFSVQIFFQPIYTDYANYAYFDNRSHAIYSSSS